MNPFSRAAPLPPGTVGERYFKSADAAKESLLARGVDSYAILEYRGEFAWIAPARAFASRALQALTAGISVVELGQR